MKDADVKKKQKELNKEATKRIKAGLFLSSYGEHKKIKVLDQEMNNALAKQMGMMPGQEKIVQDYYQKNPAALNSLKSNVYEEKIIEEIKKNAKINKKIISKEQAEKIIKEENEKSLKEQSKFYSANQNHDHDHDHSKNENPKGSEKKKTQKTYTESLKKSKSSIKKKNKEKKVSNK